MNCKIFWKIIMVVKIRDKETIVEVEADAEPPPVFDADLKQMTWYGKGKKRTQINVVSCQQSFVKAGEEKSCAECDEKG